MVAAGHDLDVPAAGRITLLLTTPRVAPGLLSWPGWQRLQRADETLTADPDPMWLAVLADAGLAVTDLGELPASQRAGRLVEAAAGGREVVWFGAADGDPGLTDALADHLARQAVAGNPPEVEVLTASHDVGGARLLDVVAVMDRLRSPGGCPWDAEQTHTSLLPYLLEETHEVIEAVERDDRDHLREELGDLLLQVAFHARVAQEHPVAPFDIDDVAEGIVAKLVRRHPHVFANAAASTPADLERSWEALKAREKPDRATFDGIPASLPALARAQKMLDRAARAGSDPTRLAEGAAAGDEVVSALFAAVILAREHGVDAEAALRAALVRLSPGPAEVYE